MDEGVRTLKLRPRWMQRYAVVLASLVVGAVVGACWRAAAAGRSADGILRVRGIVIVDEAGRERILIGAPVPTAAHRVRTDLARVKEAWAERFPPEYLDDYRSYRHDMNGVLILDERGFDRLALGDPVPDPNIGRRIASATGLAINDSAGFERTGYGLLDLEGRYRITLGMDDDEGREGLLLSLMDDGAVGLAIRQDDRMTYLGSAPANDGLVGLPEPFHGVVLRQGTEVKHLINAERSGP